MKTQDTYLFPSQNWRGRIFHDKGQCIRVGSEGRGRRRLDRRRDIASFAPVAFIAPLTLTRRLCGWRLLRVICTPPEGEHPAQRPGVHRSEQGLRIEPSSSSDGGEGRRLSTLFRILGVLNILPARTLHSMGSWFHCGVSRIASTHRRGGRSSPNVSQSRVLGVHLQLLLVCATDQSLGPG